MPDINDRGSLKSKDTLKSFFENGDIPTEDHFADLIESFSHLNDPENIKSIVRTPEGNVVITLGDDTTIEIKAKPDLAADSEKLGGQSSTAYLLKSGGSITGSLGIGTNNPEQKMHISGGLIRIQSGTDYGDLGPNSIKNQFNFNTSKGKFLFNKTLLSEGNIGLSARPTYFNAADGFIFENNIRVATQEYVDGKGFLTGVNWADIGSRPNLVGSKFSSYWGFLLPDGTDQGWLRTTSSGIIPYEDQGASKVGTPAWPFLEMHSKNYFENGTMLSQKYLGKDAKAASAVDSDKLEGLGSAAFIKKSGDTMEGPLTLNANIIGKTASDGSVSNLSRFGGLYLTWNSVTNGFNDYHSIRSTYGQVKSNAITINSYSHIRLNIDSDNNNSDSKFELGSGTRGSGNSIFSIDENGVTKTVGEIYEMNKRVATQEYVGSLFSTAFLGSGASTKARDSDKLDGKDSSEFLLKSGDTMTGDLNLTNHKIVWSENTDNAIIGFKNDSDSDANSYMYFRTADNNNEYFRWEHNSGSTIHEWMKLTGGGLTVKGSVYGSGLNATSNIAVSPGSGKGLKFWSSDSYKIYMSAVSDANWGGRVSGDGNSDHNMYFRMKGGTNRGFVFRNDKTNVAGIDASGNARFNGFITEQGTKLVDKYLGKTAKAASAANADKFANIDISKFVRKDQDKTPNSFITDHLIFNYNSEDNVDFISYNDSNDAFYFNKDRALTNTSANAKVYAATFYEGTTALSNKYLGKTAKAANADKLDGKDSSEFLLKTGGTMSGNLTVNGTITASGDITAFSDRGLKSNIQPIADSFLEKIGKLKPSFYNWKDESKSQRKQMGFIAQEVKELFPEWVHQNVEHLSMSYDKMGAVLAVKGIQELHAEINSLKAELKLMRDGIIN